MPEEKKLAWIQQALDWAYDKAVFGTGIADSAIVLADDFRKKHDLPEQAIDKLIRWQSAMCATSGFVTGLGGLITLPLTIPANVSSVLFLQLRMIAAIAMIRGYDPKTEPVKSLAIVCLAGSAAGEILKGVGIRVGEKVTESVIQKISTQAIARINRAVGFRLLSKFGSDGVINIGKAIPLVGSVVGGAFDASSTLIIGKTAKSTFAS
ncbi:EcsC family protein [Paraflavisolibacter sp. H34]|uniref:EcsC family protein n=1 Tax=Huijunlia imazamoxiresistens TaxID=3127457 RepID=UPI003019EA81